MHHNILKIMNVTLDLLIWVGLWNIYDNVLNRYKFNKNSLLIIYFLTIVFAFSTIYLLNGKFGYLSSLYEN